MLGPHQAVLASIQLMLSNPKLTEFNWLDLACGRGQLITHLNERLSTRERRKINFFGYDINKEFVNDTHRTAASMGLKSSRPHVGELEKFSKNIEPSDLKFNYISLINTVHEIHPKHLPTILFDSLQRLSAEGCLCVYDMERITPDELGAVPWSKGEVEQILQTTCRELGLADYDPAIGQTPHSTCKGWNLQIMRNYMGVSDSELQEKREHVLAAIENQITGALEEKFQVCKQFLMSLTEGGSENRKEADDRVSRLYLFWALHRALGRK